MKLIHPQGRVNGLPPQDVVYAVDDMGTTHGSGSLTYQFQPNLCPDCPVNIYLSISSTSAARYLLFGALVARARVIRQNDRCRVRLYTSVAPNDTESLNFYRENGFTDQDAEQRVVMAVPPGDGRIPMGCSVAKVPLDTPEDKAAFLGRMQQNDLTYLKPDLLAQLQTLPHFEAFGLWYTTSLAGEVLMAGIGDSAELYGIYTQEGLRRQGMARALLHRTMAVMGTQGVTRVTAGMVSRSVPQTRLLNAFGAQVTAVTAIYPGMDI